MAPRKKICRTTQEGLRAHQLGTLDAAASAAIDAHIKECDACRAALKEEQQVLAPLDWLPEEAPPPRMIADTLDSIAWESVAPGRWAELPWRNITLAVVGILLVVSLVLPALMKVRNTTKRIAGQGNLKTIGVVLRDYAANSGGKYPPHAPYDDLWTPDLRALYPEHCDDPRIFINPRHPKAGQQRESLIEALEEQPPNWEKADRIIAQSYSYFPWLLRNTDELQSAAGARGNLDPYALERDLSTGAGERFPRLREGIESSLIADINNPSDGLRALSAIPILFEAIRDPKHPPDGCNVLFLDGHTEYIEYGSAFPVLPEVAQAIAPPRP